MIRSCFAVLGEAPDSFRAGRRRQSGDAVQLESRCRAEVVPAPLRAQARLVSRPGQGRGGSPRGQPDVR